MNSKYTLTFWRFHIHFLDGVSIELFNFDEVQFIYFFLCVSHITSMKPLTNTRPWTLPLFSSNCFVVVTFVFVSLIHFQLIFKCDMQKGSNFTILHADTQLSKQHLLKNYSFLLSVSWRRLKKSVNHKHNGLFCPPNSIPAVHMCISFNSTFLDSCNIWLNFKIGQCDSYSFSHLFSGLFRVPWKSIWVLDL